MRFVIRNLFKALDDLTVIACEGDEVALSNVIRRTARLKNDGELRQSISFSGERKMLNQTRYRSMRAFEPFEKVRLTVEEVQSGTWTVVFD